MIGTAAPSAAGCPASALTIPADLGRVGSGDVAAGQHAVYKCTDAAKVRG